MRRLCVITGSRAEYDLLLNLMKELKSRKTVELQLLVTGEHLTRDTDTFFQKVMEDGLSVDSQVDMMLASNKASSVAKSVGLGVIGISAELERLNPDLVVILGDRFEALAAAQSAMIQNIPIAHIHGGEATEGLIDEAIRHSITKMAQVHFVAAKNYSKRVVQLGEHPDRVHVVGAMGLDNIANIEREPRASLEAYLKMDLSPPLFLITYHPVTLETKPKQPLDFLFCALEKFQNAKMVFTGTNVDPGGLAIDQSIQQYVSENSDRMRYRASLGAKRYLSLMSIANVVIGNSSSGIIEAPSIGVPSVNIGPRQQGRLKAPSVISCDSNYQSIVDSIERTLSPAFQNLATQKVTPYGKSGAATKVADVLENLQIETLLVKKFYNL